MYIRAYTYVFWCINIKRPQLNLRCGKVVAYVIVLRRKENKRGFYKETQLFLLPFSNLRDEIIRRVTHKRGIGTYNTTRGD